MEDLTKMIMPVGMGVVAFLRYKFGYAGVGVFAVVAWTIAMALKVSDFRRERKSRS